MQSLSVMTHQKNQFVDYSCDTGFVDLNSDITDGCECVFLSNVDTPFDGIDANCDGTDGDHSLAVHVVHL